jgi:energy-coupling factor transport system permease protein
LDFIEKIVILDRQNAPDHEFMTPSRRRHLSRRLTLGQYYPGQSSIHQLDPRTKLLASMIILALLMWVESWGALAYWTLILAAVVQRTQVPPRLFARNLRAFLWLFAITILLQALSPNFFSEASNFSYHDASPQWRVWGISVSGAGLISGIRYAWRLVLLIVVAGILSFTTVPTDLTDGVERLLKPLQRWRVPVHELAFMTTLALRFVPTIIDEAERIQKAQMSRGASFSGSLVKRIQSLVPLLVPLFVATFHRADDLAIAMEARCYRGSAGRVSFREMRLESRDVWMMASVFLCIVITIALERY